MAIYTNYIYIFFGGSQMKQRFFSSIALVLSLIFMLSAAGLLACCEEYESYTVTADTGYLKMGDVNGSGIISVGDARTVLRVAANLHRPKLTYYQSLAADVNFDGVITAADARLILRVSAGLDHFEYTEYPAVTGEEGTSM